MEDLLSIDDIFMFRCTCFCFCIEGPFNVFFLNPRAFEVEKSTFHKISLGLLKFSKAWKLF